METIQTAFPLMRAGGFFLVAAGTLFAIARLDSRRESVWMALAFMGGAAAATLALALRPSLGPPSIWHWASLGLGILIEIIGIAWANRRFAGDERRLDLAILFVVGLHFLPMAYGVGPLIAVLGLLCMGLAAFAWTRPDLAMTRVGLLDAALKIGFGLALALAYPIAWPPTFLWSQT